MSRPYRTNLATRASELVCRGLGPVRRVAAAADGTLWSASDGMGLASWPAAAPSPAAKPLPSPRRSAAAGISAGSRSLGVSSSRSAAGGAAPQKSPVRTPGHVKAVSASQVAF